jgi:electron transfer flavoprotein beta subunit
MKIIVCLKQIQHIYTRTGSNPEKKYINTEDSIYRVNPYDEAALELALRLKDADPQISVAGLSIGPMIAEPQLRRCLAAGADQLYQIEWPPASEHDPLKQPSAWIKAQLLQQAAQELKADIILCGKESLDKGNGQVGALLAQNLQWPFISAINNIQLDENNGKARVQRNAGKGVRVYLESALPSVFSVDLGVELRLPTHERKNWANAYPIAAMPIEAAASVPMTTCRGIFQPRPRTKVVPAPDSRLNAFDRINQLLTGSTVEKKGEMLTGSTDSQVEGIVHFLKENGYLEFEKSS